MVGRGDLAGAAFGDWALSVSPFALAELGGAGSAGTWLSGAGRALAPVHAWCGGFQAGCWGQGHDFVLRVANSLQVWCEAEAGVIRPPALCAATAPMDRTEPQRWSPHPEGP